jgi:hypothetical protein
MGRPKDFPNIYEDLLTKHKSKDTADKEYKECLIIAKASRPTCCCWPVVAAACPHLTLVSMEQEQGLTKDARLDDINTLPHSEQKRASSAFKPSSAKKESNITAPPEKKQRVSGTFSHSEKVSLLQSQQNGQKHRTCCCVRCRCVRCRCCRCRCFTCYAVSVNPVQELYERLVEAERQRAEAEKARGDDLREIAMALASGKKGELLTRSLKAHLKAHLKARLCLLSQRMW